MIEIPAGTELTLARGECLMPDRPLPEGDTVLTVTGVHKEYAHEQGCEHEPGSPPCLTALVEVAAEAVQRALRETAR